MCQYKIDTEFGRKEYEPKFRQYSLSTEIIYSYLNTLILWYEYVMRRATMYSKRVSVGAILVAPPSLILASENLGHEL